MTNKEFITIYYGAIVKHYCILILPFILFAACSQQQTTESAQQKNIAVARQLFEQFNKHDWNSMAALYADTALFLDPSLGTTPVPQSRRQISEKYTQLHSVFPDIRDDVQNIYPSGTDRVIVEFISTGTLPDGTTMTLPICTVFTIEDGSIVQDFTYYDN